MGCYSKMTLSFVYEQDIGRTTNYFWGHGSTPPAKPQAQTLWSYSVMRGVSESRGP